MIKYTLYVVFFLLMVGGMVSAVTDEDEDEIDWFKYYLDHNLGYGSTISYTGLHAPTFDYSDFYRIPSISNIQDTFTYSGADGTIAQSTYNQNTGFTITSSPAGAEVYVNGEYKGKTRTLNSLKIFGLDSGTYEVVLSYPGYHTYTEIFSLFHNEVQKINVILSPLENIVLEKE